MTDDRIGVAFAGCGSISRLYTDIYAGLSDVARVVAVADPQPERAEHRRARQIEAYHAASHAARLRAGESRDDETRAQELRKAALAQSAATAGIRVYRDHEGLLRDEEVQAMVLLTTPTVRSEPTIAAAEAGRHVFTQGPMAASVADAAAMADAVRRAGVKFHSQCGARYPRGIALARRAIEKSLLGQVASARVELNWFRPQSYYQGWHGTWSGEGGGAAFHHGRYIIDPFLWVLGSRVVELFAYAGPALREIEHENLTHAAMRYSNGATGTIHASLLNHKQRLTPSGRFEILGRDASMLVGEEYFNQGAPGANYWEADTSFGFGDGAAVAALDALADEVSEVPERASEEYQSRLFLESIANDSDPLVPIEVPMHHVEIVRALYKSAHEGAPVSLPLDKDDPFYTFEGRIA